MRYCDGVQGRPRFDRGPAVAEAESDELKSSGKESVGFID